MNELILALVALVALVVMIRKNTFKTFPAPSRCLALGLGIILVTRLLGWVTMTYLSRTLTIDTFATAHTVIYLVMSTALAIALTCMIAAVFVSRHPSNIVNTVQS